MANSDVLSNGFSPLGEAQLLNSMLPLELLQWEIICIFFENKHITKYSSLYFLSQKHIQPPLIGSAFPNIL